MHPVTAQCIGQSDHLSMHGKQPTNEGFSITQEDSDILKQYLDEFKHANTSDRTNLIDKVMGELYLLRPATYALIRRTPGWCVALLHNPCLSYLMI
jgi:hypothetical protein